MINFDELRDKAMQIATEVHKTQVDKGGSHTWDIHFVLRSCARTMTVR